MSDKQLAVLLQEIVDRLYTEVENIDTALEEGPEEVAQNIERYSIKKYVGDTLGGLTDTDNYKHDYWGDAIVLANITEYISDLQKHIEMLVVK